MSEIRYRVMGIEQWLDVVLCLKERGLSTSVIANVLGRKTNWVHALLSIAREPVARALINAERLSSIEAWEQFMSLAPIERKRLMESSEPISHSRCEHVARWHRKTPQQGFSA